MSIGNIGSGIGLGGNPQDSLFGASAGTDSETDLTGLTGIMGSSFKASIDAELKKMQPKVSMDHKPNEETLQAVMLQTPVPKKEIDELARQLADKIKTLFEKPMAEMDINKFLDIQESMLALFRLFEDYGSKSAAEELADVYSVMDDSNPTRMRLKKNLESKIKGWATIDQLSFSARPDIMSNQEKKTETRKMQYMLLISLQLHLQPKDPILSDVAKSDQIQEATGIHGVGRQTAGEIDLDSFVSETAVDIDTPLEE
jgi:hypothetical protein